MYLTLRQSIKLLAIEYQKGHASHDERAHFLVFKKVGGHRAQRHPVPRPLIAHTEFLTSRLKIPRRYLDLLEPIKITISLTGTKPDNYSVFDLIYHL